MIQKTLFGMFYPYCDLVNRVLPNITLDGLKLRVMPGVYKPLDGEHRVVDCIDSGKTVLDVGCGSGVITVFAALKSKHVTAIDISPQAIANTRWNCAAQGIENVTVLASDMFAAVEEQRFDYIISYPPLFQGSFASEDRQWCTSSHFVGELFGGARDHLTPDGKLVVLLPKEFRTSPQELAAANGLEFVSAVPHRDGSFAVRLHAIPYLHFNMDNQVFTFRRPPLA